MPKETINYPRERVEWTPQADSESPEAWLASQSESMRDPQVSVGWNRDSWVQVSIEGDVKMFAQCMEYTDGDDSGRTTIYTPPLSRDEINKLIRTLRRARDQVFGRDE